MASKSLSSFIDAGVDVLGSERNATNGGLSVQTGDAVNGEVSCDNAEWWQHVGYASLPSNPEQGKPACQALSMEQVDRDICYASRDLRSTSIYGTLRAGETCVYSAGPQGQGTNRILLKDDGSTATITILTQEGNSSSGDPVLVQVSSEGKVMISAGSHGAVSIDSDGVKIVSNSAMQLGGSGDTTIIGQSIALNGANVSLGAAATNPVALTTALLPLLAAYQAVFAAMTTALGDGGILTNPAAPSYSVLTAALGTIAGLTPTVAQVPSTSVFAGA